MTTNKLKALAVAASATVQRYTPATIGKITREDMAVCQAYQVAAVPGHIVEMFDEIERLTAVEESVLAMARMLNSREWAEHVGKGAASELESAITSLHNELAQARETADNLASEIEHLTVNRGFLLADLQEAATTLRRYETLHRAKGTEESTAKAEVNAELAARFESTIKAVQP